MLLKQLFTSTTRIKLLNYFFNNPESEEFIRELTRILDEQINSIRRELNSLHKIGLFLTRSRKRKKYYRLNPEFIFYAELKSIFTKANSNSNDLVRKLQKIGDLKLIVLTGSFLGKESTTDLLLVGQIDKDEVAKLLEQEVESEQAVRFSLMPTEDFLYRVKCNDRFVMDIISNSENILALNTFDNKILNHN